MIKFWRYIRKVYYTVGSSEVVSGCFVIKALTHKGLYLKTCAKQYDLQKKLNNNIYIVKMEVVR